MLSVTNKPFMLSVVILSVVMPNVIILSVVMLNVVILSVVLLSVFMLNVTILSVVKRRYAECRYIKRRYAECRGTGNHFTTRQRVKLECIILGPCLIFAGKVKSLTYRTDCIKVVFYLVVNIRQ